MGPHTSVSRLYTTRVVVDKIRRLNVIHPDIKESTILGSTCGILIVLFLIQPLGTSKIGTLFAPIVIIWLIFNLSFGIYVSYT